MLPTVADVLGLPAVRRGSPRVIVGDDRLGRPVRWVHVLELADAAHLLQGGEFVLTTGIALPEDPASLGRYATDLAVAGVSALAVELGRRYRTDLPAALRNAAEDGGLPLIAFEREVPFVEITEAVHARIIDSQLEELRVSERLHEVFTELSVSGASPDEIIQQASALAGRPVILADLAHHVLACAPAGADPARLLAGFAARSRAAKTMNAKMMNARTGYDEALGWLITTVGARGEDWGRVILVTDRPPASTDTVLIERAATTLALGRLLTRQAESVERQAHRTLISGIIAQAHGDPAEAAMRARALGVPVDGRQLVAIVLRRGGDGPGISAHARMLAVADQVATACRALNVPALVGTLDDTRAAALLSISPRASVDDTLTTLALRVRERQEGLVIGAGATVTGIDAVRRSFLEAGQVADAATGHGEQPFYRLPDLHVRGLLHLLRDDPRLQTFVDRELGPLLTDPELLTVLTEYLKAGGNKAVAAKTSHLARPTFYDRLHRIERALGVSLDDPQTRTSLHVAILAREHR